MRMGFQGLPKIAYYVWTVWKAYLRAFETQYINDLRQHNNPNSQRLQPSPRIELTNETRQHPTLLGDIPVDEKRSEDASQPTVEHERDNRARLMEQQRQTNHAFGALSVAQEEPKGLTANLGQELFGNAVPRPNIISQQVPSTLSAGYLRYPDQRAMQHQPQQSGSLPPDPLLGAATFKEIDPPHPVPPPATYMVPGIQRPIKWPTAEVQVAAHSLIVKLKGDFAKSRMFSVTFFCSYS